MITLVVAAVFYVVFDLVVPDTRYPPVESASDGFEHASASVAFQVFYAKNSMCNSLKPLLPREFAEYPTPSYAETSDFIHLVVLLKAIAH